MAELVVTLFPDDREVVWCNAGGWTRPEREGEKEHLYLCVLPAYHDGRHRWRSHGYEVAFEVTDA